MSDFCPRCGPNATEEDMARCERENNVLASEIARSVIAAITSKNRIRLKRGEVGAWLASLPRDPCASD